MASERFKLFDKLTEIERNEGKTFFVIVLTPDMYVYHKKDSIEASLALKGRSVAAVCSSVQKLDSDVKPGKLIVRKHLQYHHMWWKPLKKIMDTCSAEYNWFWLFIAFDGTRMLFTAESHNFPLTPENRQTLIDDVDTVWTESSRADIEHARDTYIRRILDITRYAVNNEFFERKGIRRI